MVSSFAEPASNQLCCVSSCSRIQLFHALKMKYWPGVCAASSFMRFRALASPATDSSHLALVSGVPDKISRAKSCIFVLTLRENGPKFSRGTEALPTVNIDRAPDGDGSPL